MKKHDGKYYYERDDYGARRARNFKRRLIWVCIAMAFLAVTGWSLVALAIGGN